MKRKTFALIATSIILTLAMITSVAGCSSEESLPTAGNGNEAVDEVTDPTQVQDEAADEDTAETTVTASPETAENNSDTSDEANDGSNEPADNSEQTTIKPAATTTQNSTKPATTTAATATTTTKPSAAPVTTTAKTTKPAGSTTTTTAPAPAVTTKPAPAVTTTPKPAVTTTPAPAVTTTPAPAVTTTPAPAHTHSYSSKITKEPTCTATGVKTYTCSCGDSYTESIPAKGHDWHSETIHHDAVTGERDKTEQWVKVTWTVWVHLTQAGKDAGLSSSEYPDYYKVLAAEYWGNPNDPSSIEWVYRYDNSSDPIASCAGYYCGDFLAKGYSDGTYNATDTYAYEDRVVGTETYVIKDAYDETITTCTVCGAKK